MYENIIKINLDNYPDLLKLKLDDPERFQVYMKNVFLLGDFAAKKGYSDSAEKYFGVDYPVLIREITAALFDYKGILKHHHNKQEAEAMQILEMENNPLAATNYFSTRGETLTKETFNGENDLSIQAWFQGLLYAGKYLSHKDLVKYLLLPDYHLVENMQNEHIQRLIKIQPALKYQQENDIRVGAYHPGTGFFDVGRIPFKTNHCPICYSDRIYTEPFHEMRYCLNCNAGFSYAVTV